MRYRFKGWESTTSFLFGVASWGWMEYGIAEKWNGTYRDILQV